MNVVFLMTGSNIGDRNKNLRTAEAQVNKIIGEVILSSSIYETAPWGNALQESFYNQALKIKTPLTANEVMEAILKIEHRMGRKRTFKNAARIIDIDILFFNDLVCKTKSIEIPHKEIINRRFVLEPLNEIARDLVHPALHKKINTLLKVCMDPLKVFRIKEN
ncbi:MAG: 2-amino-4-hydroxy-6-hydroxymethyldihydropteridine diphosphokinase [Ginsengibacter sp.]